MMGRHVSGLFLVFGVLALTAVIGITHAPLAPAAFAAEPPAPAAPTSTAYPIELERVGPDFPPSMPFSVDAASDTCEAATSIPLPGGDQSQVNSMTESSSDPVLTCAWGTPPRSQGYRTVWYKFTAPQSGVATVGTFYSTYDTILAAYQGGCSSLTMLACNDDYQGFSSRTSFAVTRDVTYYIEVADWQAGVPGTATLSLAALLEPVNSWWEPQENAPMARSRHALAVVGPDIYLIGGETGSLNTPTLTRSVQRYETDTGNWVTLQDMPGTGYSNTSATYMNGRIYVPSGYNGNDNAFDGTHWVYDIAANYWFTVTSAPWPTGSPMAWGTAVTPQNSTLPGGYFLVGGTSDQPFFERNGVNPTIPQDDVLYYVRDLDSWSTTLFPPMTTARFAHTAAWVGDRLCVAGGIGLNESSQNIQLTNGECYRPSSGVWTPTGDMAIPRYNAGSAVGPDGKWYVFGGIDSQGRAVEITEVYNRASNSWTALGASYDLGDPTNRLPRAWPRGAFVGNALWVFDGNTYPNNQAVQLVDRLRLIIPRKWFPTVTSSDGPLPHSASPNDSFATAWPLALNQAQDQNFDDALDFYDTYYFDLSALRAVTIRLTHIPSSSDYNLAVYSNNKLLWGEGVNPGNQDEVVTLTLPAGRHYIVVERIFPGGPPSSSRYRIAVEG